MSRRSRWIIGPGVLLASLAILLTGVDQVQATFDVLHAMQVYARVDVEIIQTTPAGRYYRDLSVKHLREFIQILDAHPEHHQELMDALLLFVPESEALLNGEGDKVFISSEHVDSLQAELDWFASKGSPSLQEDLQKEQQRLPPDQFVGMTMSEAWEFINSKWTPDMVVQPASPPVPGAGSGQPVLVKDRTMVPGSSGKWAYSVINGVYLEYSMNHSIAIAETDRGAFITITRFTDRIDVQHTPLMSVQIVQETPSDKAMLDPAVQFNNIVWKRSIHNDEFEGTEFVVRASNVPVISVFAVLYSEEEQIAVGMQMEVHEDTFVSEDADYAAMLDHEFEFFQHMVDSLRVKVP